MNVLPGVTAEHNSMTRGRQPSSWVSEIGSSERFTAAPADLKQKVYAEQVRSLYAVTQYAYRTSIIFAVLVFLNFYTRIPYWPLLAWFLGISFICVARFVVSRRFFYLAPADDELKPWARTAMALLAAEAAGWMLVLLIAIQTGQAVDIAFAVFLICALAFGGFAALGFFLPAYLLFAAPLFLALWVWLLSLGPADTLWLAVLVAFGSLAIFDSAVNSTRIIRGALLLGYEREALIRRLTEEKERAQVTLRSIGDGVITTDTHGAVTYVNPVAERLTGWRNEEACGRQLEEVLRLVHETTQEPLPDPVRLCLDRQGLVVLEEETMLMDRSGERESSVEVTISPIRDFERRIIGVVVAVHDVTELRGMARVMSYQANHDPLTGLVNRREFEASLWHALESARTDRLDHAMCYLDLDQFKLVNDTCGHVAGDELLKQTSELLMRRVRDTDILARLGGDEFGILLQGCSLAKAREIAEDICGAIRDFRFVWEDKVFTIGVSIGLVPVDSTSSPSDLLAAADAACYVAKDQGRNRVHIVHPHDRELAHRHGEMQWTTRIQRALDLDLFRLRFQRIEPLEGEQTVLAEFLVSMQGHDGEMIAPGMFLPAAERFNMMPAIDRRVVRMVFERLASHDPQLAGIHRFTINLSGQSLSDESFLDYVQRQIADTGVDPNKICFEITETAVIANMARAKRFIHALRERGCHFALDDFGSGLSSFGYLRTLPVEYLKIDGVFVKDMCEDPIDYSMVEAINQVGHVMGIKTIAEFVEDEAVLDALRKLGVDYGQGFGLHRPQWLEQG
jgi:diguanylate cyclase (GGDEF)-like protein/PAS domain S-box-containing protein